MLRARLLSIRIALMAVVPMGIAIGCSASNPADDAVVIITETPDDAEAEAEAVPAPAEAPTAP